MRFHFIHTGIFPSLFICAACGAGSTEDLDDTGQTPVGSGGTAVGTGGLGTGGVLAVGGSSGGTNTGGGGSTGTGGDTSSGGQGPNSSAGGEPSTGGSLPGAGGTGGDPSGNAGGDSGSGGGVVIGDLPLVYDEEHTGADCADPVLPSFGELESISHLPDPFLMPDGERMTSRVQWRCQRHKIRRVLEEYDVGLKPGKPSTFEASFEGNTLSIVLGEGGNSFTLTAPINRPASAGDGPIPAIIGINSPTGSLPAEVFSSRGIATITFSSDQLHGNGFSGTSRQSGNFWDLYPGATAGSMIRWAWGVSRIIDALQELPETNIDTTHLAVSGCSFQGKIALYAGAFDERIALTIPHESGGGGTISWRYSDMLEDRDNTEVENLHHALGAPWYHPDLGQFADVPEKLPFDHHELIAMVAPRAFLAVESSQIARMGAEAARVDALAARRVYSALGVPYRMGATEENTGHCSWHDGYTADLEAYVDKYLLGHVEVDTDILRSIYDIDTDTWIPWETPELE